MSDSKATVPVSGRVAEEDYLFLMEHPIPGKVTASEKLRYIVSFFRTYHESFAHFEDSLVELHRLLEPARKEIKLAEVNAAVSSELMDKLLQILPEMLAALITTRLSRDPGKGLEGLLEMEQRMLRGVMGVMEAVLRMGLTSKSPTYNPNLLKDRMSTIRELVDLGRPK